MLSGTHPASDADKLAVRSAEELTMPSRRGVQLEVKGAITVELRNINAAGMYIELRKETLIEDGR